jgi:hypothetical protein
MAGPKGKEKILDASLEIISQRGPMPVRLLMDILHGDGYSIPTSRELGHWLRKDRKKRFLNLPEARNSVGGLVQGRLWGIKTRER